MSASEWVNTAINGLVAVGTIAVAVMAIWGEKVRACWAAPELEIQLHTPRGIATSLCIEGAISPGGGLAVMYYHLKVVNLKPWLVVRDCRVLLKGISVRRPNAGFKAVELPVPIQLVWSNEGDTSHRVTVTSERVLDFVRIAGGADMVEPVLYTVPNNFEGYVEKGKAIRYHLQIDAENFVSPRPQVFEVAWDGEWFHQSDKMELHLTLKEILTPQWAVAGDQPTGRL